MAHCGMRPLTTLSVALAALALTGCPEPAPGTDAGPPAVDAGPPAPPPDPIAAVAPYAAYVDPMIGTGGGGYNDIGSAYPGPARPFGLVHVGPDTASEDGGSPTFLHCSGFAASDPFVTGFSHARMHGTGIADYGNVALMPVPAMDPSYVTQAGSRARMVDGTREASAGYFAVTLERGEVRVELTSRERVALHRYTFQPGAPQAVLVDVGHTLATELSIVEASVEVDAAAREVTGMARVDGGYSGRFGGARVFFVARFDRAVVEHGVWQGDALTPSGGSAEGPRSGAWVAFDPSEGAVVRAEVAISMVDLEGARANLAAETAGYDFDAVRAESEQAWEAMLSRARISARYPYDLTRFYTALYHALLMPTLASDADGRYRGLDDEIHVADGFAYYTDFSLWDTYRTLHPLLTLLYPERQADMLRSLVAMATDGGAMPRWPLGHGYTGGMIGDPVAIVIADSIQKGLTDFDLRAAYDALRRSAFGEASALFAGRGHAETYERLGYVPMEAGGWSAAKTMEFAYADHAMATIAEALGEAADAARFRERASSWQNHWDPTREFFVGRHEDGRFVEDFEESTWQDFYAEGNARQYLWLVPHDLDGLFEQMGGRDVALTRLEGLFAESRRERRHALPPLWYWHGNEPDLHASFVFTALGRPDRAGVWSRWVAQTMYGDGPTGLPGNDDAGTLSAWLVFATLGFYAISGEDHYLVAAPLATRAELDVAGGTFVIEAPDASDARPAPRAATFDGAPVEDFRLPHDALVGGGTLRFEMGPDEGL